METESSRSTTNVVRIEISDPALTAVVLERLVSGAAVHADLPLDRMFDALSVVDAMISAADRSLDGETRHFSLEIEPGCLRLSLTGLEDAQAEVLIAAANVPAVGNVIERLSGGVEIRADGEGKALTVQLT